MKNHPITIHQKRNKFKQIKPSGAGPRHEIKLVDQLSSRVTSKTNMPKPVSDRTLCVWWWDFSIRSDFGTIVCFPPSLFTISAHLNSIRFRKRRPICPQWKTHTIQFATPFAITQPARMGKYGAASVKRWGVSMVPYRSAKGCLDASKCITMPKVPHQEQCREPGRHERLKNP